MRSSTPVIFWVLFGVLIGVVVVFGRSLLVERITNSSMSWINEWGWWGPGVFMLFYIVATVLFAPVIVLTVTAGALFGLWIGVLTVSLATTSSAALTFLIARYLARERVSHWIQEKPRVAALASAVKQGGWKILALLRLSVLLPFSVQNYLYGLTSIGFWSYLLTSWLAMLPGTFLYVYLGHAAGITVRGAVERTGAEWAALGVSLTATVIVSLYLASRARKRLHVYTRLEEPVT
jgi:uncharacterized membrane protein YdjX (TVP38/TMEM64 family)